MLLYSLRLLLEQTSEQETRHQSFNYLVLVTKLFEIVFRFIFRPFAIYLGLGSSARRGPTPNNVLEDAYLASTKTKNKKISHEQVKNSLNQLLFQIVAIED